MQHLQPNTTLQGGKYKISRVLGQGGFGITYLARDASLGVYVAVKEFFMKDLCGRNEATLSMYSSGGSLGQVERYRAKFIKEARNLSRLHHRNIISAIDVFEENDTVYYTMPYIKGGSLQDYVMRKGPLTEMEAMKIVGQIADALKYMHEVEHICHYDVKPSNILLDDRGNAMLIDFGISKNYDESGHETSTTPIGMSEGYAPIEQYQQNVEEFSPASDVYGLGATLLFAMTGQRPPSVIDRVSGTPLEMPRYCSDAVKNIITSSTIIQKKYRAQSVKVFLDYNLSNSPANSGKSNTVLPQNEETIIENKHSAPNNYGTYSRQGYTQTNYTPNQNKSDSYTQRPAQSNHKQSASSKQHTDYSGFFIFLGIIVVGILLLFFQMTKKNNNIEPSQKITSHIDYKTRALANIEEANALRLAADTIILGHPDEYTDASIYNYVEDNYIRALKKLDEALDYKDLLDADVVDTILQQQLVIKFGLYEVYKSLDAGAEYVQEFRTRADAIKPYIADILDSQ